MEQRENPARKVTNELLVSGITCELGYSRGNMRLQLHAQKKRRSHTQSTCMFLRNVGSASFKVHVRRAVTS